LPSQQVQMGQTTTSVANFN